MWYMQHVLVVDRFYLLNKSTHNGKNSVVQISSLFYLFMDTKYCASFLSIQIQIQV